jgi:iron complex transport system permease protein
MSREAIYQQKAQAARKFGYCLAGLIGAAVMSVFLGCMFGRLPIPMASVFQAFLAKAGLLGAGFLEPTWEEVIFQIRLSRICLSLLVGMSLAVAGTTFQGVLRNPLADPFTLGVSTGAACAASLAIFMGLAAKTAFGMGLLPLAALGGAMAALAAVLTLGRVNGRLRRDTLILAGIVVATFLSALISLLKSLDEESVSSIVFWVMGSFQGRGWPQVIFALPYILAGLIIVGWNSRELDLLALGEMQARQMGVEVDRARRRLLIGASLLTAGAVSVSGIIGFVGLVVPHLLRLVIGAEHRPLLILAGILGGLALLWSDVLARVILPGGEELPVGVVTAILGGPFFCLLLKRRREGEIV